jgi:hypothetical protein
LLLINKRTKQMLLNYHHMSTQTYIKTHKSTEWVHSNIFFRRQQIDANLYEHFFTVYTFFYLIFFFIRIYNINITTWNYSEFLNSKNKIKESHLLSSKFIGIKVLIQQGFYQKLFFSIKNKFKRPNSYEN